MSGVGQTIALLAELPLQIESCSIEPLSRQLAPRSNRHTTLVDLFGGDQE